MVRHQGTSLRFPLMTAQKSLPLGWFAFDDAPLPYPRLGFAPLTPRELREAVRRLATALPA